MSDTNSASQDTSPVSEVQQPSGETAGADEIEGKVFQCHAEFSTNVYISDVIMNGHDEDGIDDPDSANAADALDADAFEILTGNITASSAAIPNEVPPVEPAEPMQPLTDSLIQAEEANSEPIAELSITRFTYGSPGAPIPGPVQCSAVYGPSQVAPSSLDWALFSSKLNWEIARWAKIRGPTSLALTELLAIPGVCGPCLALNDSLTCRVRSLNDLASRTKQQTSWIASLTTIFLGALHSSLGNLSSEVNTLNSTIERFCHPSRPSLATRNSLMIWYLLLSDITMTLNRSIESTLRCTPETGGGPYRCVSRNSDLFERSHVMLDITRISASRCHGHPTHRFF